VTCHGAGDLVKGPNCDWARISGAPAILQKLIIFFAITKGEVINAPDVGCCLHNYLFDKLTENNLLMMAMELEYDLKRQIPELGVQNVKATKGKTKDTVSLTILSRTGTLILQVSRDELLDINLLNEFGVII
jgi:phage baseplate assembly protein W